MHLARRRQLIKSLGAGLIAMTQGCIRSVTAATPADSIVTAWIAVTKLPSRHRACVTLRRKGSEGQIYTASLVGIAPRDDELFRIDLPRGDYDIRVGVFPSTATCDQVRCETADGSDSYCVTGDLRITGRRFASARIAAIESDAIEFDDDWRSFMFRATSRDFAILAKNDGSPQTLTRIANLDKALEQFGRAVITRQESADETAYFLTLNTSDDLALIEEAVYGQKLTREFDLGRHDDLARFGPVYEHADGSRSVVVFDSRAARPSGRARRPAKSTPPVMSDARRRQAVTAAFAESVTSLSGDTTSLPISVVRVPSLKSVPGRTSPRTSVAQPSETSVPSSWLDRIWKGVESSDRTPRRETPPDWSVATIDTTMVCTSCREVDNDRLTRVLVNFATGDTAPRLFVGYSDDFKAGHGHATSVYGVLSARGTGGLPAGILEGVPHIAVAWPDSGFKPRDDDVVRRAKLYGDLLRWLAGYELLHHDWPPLADDRVARVISITTEFSSFDGIERIPEAREEMFCAVADITTATIHRRGCVIVVAGQNHVEEFMPEAGYHIPPLPGVVFVAGNWLDTPSRTHPWGGNAYGAMLTLTAPSGGIATIDNDYVDDCRIPANGSTPTKVHPGALTSFAAPIVAGTAGRILLANPSLMAREVVDVLHATARVIDPEAGRGSVADGAPPDQGLLDGRWMKVSLDGTRVLDTTPEHPPQGDQQSQTESFRWFSLWYGYGEVHATAAVRLAASMAGK